MKMSGPTKKWVLAAIGFLIALLIFKIVLLLTSKPKIVVDYVAEYNKFTRPQNYDSNENAASYYQRAFDSFVKMPDELSIAVEKSYIVWPADFNSTEQAILERWLASNSQAFEFFKMAVNKHYYWLERHAKEDNDMYSIRLPELILLRKLTETLIWDAKLNAAKGQYQQAFEDILDCYKAGGHKCRPELLNTEQFIGLAIKQNAVQNTFIILDRVNCDNKSLKFLQDKLQTEFDDDTYIPNIQAEKFPLYDTLQRVFLDDGKGTGRLSWRMCWDASTGCSDLASKCPFLSQAIWPNLKLRLNCFIGPTRNETAQKIGQTISISNQMMTKTPWQIKNEGRDYLEEIENVNNSNFLLKLPIGISPYGIYYQYYNTKIRTEALVAVLAILRFKTETGQFPETLNDLVSKSYLKTIPQDPYSNNALIYEPANENFKLYSVGPDFKDDKGIDESTDIIFWPVKEMRYDIQEAYPSLLKLRRIGQPLQKLSE